MAPALVAGVLERIETLLADNLAGAPADEVIARDFGGYWGGERTLYVSGPTQNGQQFNLVHEQNSQRQWLVSKDEETWLNVDAQKSSQSPWIVLRLGQPATSLNTETWPPKTTADLLEWIDDNIPSSVSKLIGLIRRSVLSKGKQKQKNYSTELGVVLIWPDSSGADTLGCGFSFKIPEIPAQAIGQGRLRQAANLLMRDGGKIARYSLSRADPRYIQTRNTPNDEPSLRNRRVILIGAGTIGGHLAKLLCAHSAGWGPRGELHIVDPDRFSIENIGRHLLGAGSLDENKALAVAGCLQRDFPYLRIIAHPNSITDCWHLLNDSSIIVDATGSQTVGVAIPDYLSKKRLTPVVLHSWVHGHGAATVALLNDRRANRSACFRCLWRVENNTYQPRYPLSRAPEQDAPVFAGCHHSFHAYAATVSMKAATQAMTLLKDHLAGQVDNTLRFQILRPDLCQNRPDKTPIAANDCPICVR